MVNFEVHSGKTMHDGTAMHTKLTKLKLDLYLTGLYYVLYWNIDLTLLNKLHGPMHCKIGVARVYNAHVFYTMTSNPPISQFNSPCEYTSVWSMFICNIHPIIKVIEKVHHLSKTAVIFDHLPLKGTLV